MRMTRIGKAALSGLILPLLAISPQPAAAKRVAGADRPLVFDVHADLPKPDGSEDRIAIDLLRRGGVDAIAIAAFVPTGAHDAAGYAAAAKALDERLRAIHAIAAAHSDKAAIARSATDIRRIVASGRTAIVVSFLNAYALGEDDDGIARLYREGVRIAGLAHRGNNAFADSSRLLPDDRPDENGGLSARGRRAVAEMNRLGILIDISQLTPAGVAQTLALSRAPVIASHSDVRALVDNPRNLSDAQLRAIAAKGGVVAINAFGAYLHKVTPAERARIDAAAAKVGGNPMDGIRMADAPTKAFLAEVGDIYHAGTSVADLVDHIDHAVRLIGIDHVAISSDFNHGGGVIGWHDAGETRNVTAELRRRHYSQADIAKLWSGNALRVLAAAERAATAR